MGNHHVLEIMKSFILSVCCPYFTFPFFDKCLSFEHLSSKKWILAVFQDVFNYCITENEVLVGFEKFSHIFLFDIRIIEIKTNEID